MTLHWHAVAAMTYPPGASRLISRRGMVPLSMRVYGADILCIQLAASLLFESYFQVAYERCRKRLQLTVEHIVFFLSSLNRGSTKNSFSYGYGCGYAGKSVFLSEASRLRFYRWTYEHDDKYTTSQVS